MANRKNNDDLRLLITNLMNEKQDKHSRLVENLRAEIGNTKEFDDIVRLLTKIYEAKINTLEEVLREL